MPATSEPTPILPGLSPICGRDIEARFDGGLMSSDGGLLALREIDRHLGLAKRMAGFIADPRMPERIQHGLDEIIRFRMMMIVAGYEDGNDADHLRTDPIFKLALDRLPPHRDLCSQSTISRTENMPDSRALLRIGRAMVDHYCQSFGHVPKRIVLDIDDTFDVVHGCQQLRLFNAHYDEYGFQPIVVFDGEGRMIAAVLRPASRPKGTQIVKWLRRLISALRANWPRVNILLRADGHYCTPEVLRFCRAAHLDYVLGVAPTTTLRKHVGALENSMASHPATTGGQKWRRFKTFYDGAAPGTRSSVLSRASRQGRRVSIHALSSRAWPISVGGSSTRISTVRVARRKIISRPGKPTSRPTAPHAPGQPQTRCACFCTSGLIG